MKKLQVIELTLEKPPKHGAPALYTSSLKGWSAWALEDARVIALRLRAPQAIEGSWRIPFEKVVSYQVSSVTADDSE